MAKKRPTRLYRKEKTIRKVVPISLIEIKDVYKSKLEKTLKPKYSKSLNDITIFEILMKSLKDIPEKEILRNIPKKYFR